MKRTFDILFALFALILTSWVFLLIALFIKLSSRGPIFFASRRIGKMGKVIYCLKFRTMYLDAEEKLNDLLSSHSELKKEWMTFQKLKHDPRITPVGSFLRKTSLDELPQFFDVLKGTLSVVGPRPLLLSNEEKLSEEIQRTFGDKSTKILSVKPGLTGLWQISGRSRLSLEERLRLDETYIDNQSLLYDLILIFKTIPLMLFPDGAF